MLELQVKLDSHLECKDRGVRVLLLLFSLLLNIAFAQTPNPIALIPLDSRPANASLPVAIAKMGQLEMVTPPAEMLGTAVKPADAQAIRAWLDTVQPSALVVSLDALAYGGLVQSRTSLISADAAWDNLWSAWFWHLSSPVYAFIVIPRAPDAVDRERNLEVIRRALNWAADGTLQRLFVTWDDALPGSPAPLEGAAIRSEVEARGLTNVFVYPGADEVASALTASLMLERQKQRPKIRIKFSDPSAASSLIAPYEGQTLLQSVQNQTKAIGLELSDQSDLELYVFNGGDPRKAALEINTDQRRGLVALADVNAVNLANRKLIEDLVASGGFADLAGFAAWGTPGNNIGSALAQATMFAVYGISDASNAMLARGYVNDYLYSSLLRPKLRQGQLEANFANDNLRQELLSGLQTQLKSFRLGTTKFKVVDAYFPWLRSFEIGFDLESRPISTACQPVCFTP
jgi:Protein of unknown function (DUF4127)